MEWICQWTGHSLRYEKSFYFLNLLKRLIVHFVQIEQEYAEEFREIAGKSKRFASTSGGEGTITLLTQRHVGEDLPVRIISN